MIFPSGAGLRMGQPAREYASRAILAQFSPYVTFDEGPGCAGITTESKGHAPLLQLD